MTVPAKEVPGLGSPFAWSLHVLPHQCFDRCFVLTGQPMCQFPERNAIQMLIHVGCVIRVLMEVGPAGELPVQRFHHIDRVHMIVAGESRGQFPRQTAALLLGNGRDRAHHAPWPPFANDPMA